MKDRLFRILPLALVALPLALGAGCSSGEPEGELNAPPAMSGRGARGGAQATGAGGTSALGGSNATGSGGTAVSSGGSSSGATGGSTTGGSGGSGAVSSVACQGLPYDAAEGGSGGEDACVGVGSEAEPVPVDLFIMMDRSDSMANLVPGTDQMRWDALRDAVQAFVDATTEDDDIRAGIGFFGRTGGNDEALDCDVLHYAAPEVELGSLAEVGADLVGAMTDTFPAGLTPTAPALTGALEYAASFAEDNPDRAAFVVLVTDGYPTQCEPNTIAGIADIAENARMTEPNVRTYVIGLDAGFNLDTIAIAGGTNQAFLVDETNISDSFVQALRNASNARLACEYSIPPPPSGSEVVDFTEVQVTYTTAEAETEEIPHIADLEACARNANGGWYYDNPDDPTRIKVCPCTCTRFQAGRVDVRLGCKPKIGLR
jgi:hypothetical protein